MKTTDYYGDGGRLSGEPDEILIKTAYAHDSADANILLTGLHKADLAHATMLIEQGIIPEDEGVRLLEGLLSIEAIPSSIFPIDPKNGDVYNSKDIYLKNIIGNVAGWLHIGRPRREAVNIAYLIAVRKKLAVLSEAIEKLAISLLRVSKNNKDVITPDFTYLLHAHPTRLGHYLSTYLFGLLRDMDRIRSSYSRLNRSPAGSGSVNGSSLPLNRDRLCDFLGFDEIIPHSRDAMWQIDVPMEIMANLNMIMTNINRLADELQIWNTAEFGTVELPDGLCRASVIMPQKKNPYPLAYIRGVTSQISGMLAGFSAHGKGPSGNPDSRIFIYGDLPNAIDKCSGALNLFSAVLDGIKFNEKILLKRVKEGFSFATDLSDYLATKEKIDYRSAHKIAGLLVKNMLERGLTGDKLTSELVNEAISSITNQSVNIPPSLIEFLKNPSAMIDAKNTIGGAGQKPIEELFFKADSKISNFNNWRRVLNLSSAFDKMDKAISKLTMPNKSFAEIIAEKVEEFPNKIALIEGQDRVFTYTQLFRHSKLISNLIKDSRNSRIAIKINDKPNHVASILGIHLSSNTAVSIDVNDLNLIISMIDDCDPNIFLYEQSAISVQDLNKLKIRYKKISFIIAPEIDGTDKKQLPKAALKVPPLNPNDKAHIFYTSGTTGNRKGVVISQSAYVVPGLTLNMAMKYSPDIREYVYGNISHAFPFGRVRALLFSGGTVIFDNGNVIPQKIIARIKQHQGNAIGAPAAIIKILITQFKQDFLLLSNQLLVIKMGTQAIAPETKKLLISSFPKTQLFQQYGMSESPRTVLNDLHEATSQNVTGRVLAGYKISIRDENNIDIIEPNRKGRVWLSGPHLASEYWRNSKKSSESFVDGWFITDDIGTLDEEGQLTIYGRVDEIINCGGQKLNPSDIEDIIEPFLNNQKFVVFGINDPADLLGEVPAIIIENNKSTDLMKYNDWQKIRISILRSLDKSSKFLPKYGFTINQIPSTSSGKPKRKILSELVNSQT